MPIDSNHSSLQPTKKSLTDWAHEWMAVIFAPVARALQRIGVTPNTLTILGFVLGLAGGVLIAVGRWPIAVGVLITSGLLDGFDGLLARQTNQTTRFGAFLDSVLDRWSDSSIFIGLLIWYSGQGMQMEASLSGVALASSVLVSYTRARAEGIGARCNRGLFTRLERFVSVLVGLVSKQMTLALWVIALLSTFTAFQRIYYTLRYVQTHLDEELPAGGMLRD